MIDWKSRAPEPVHKLVLPKHWREMSIGDVLKALEGKYSLEEVTEAIMMCEPPVDVQDTSEPSVYSLTRLSPREFIAFAVDRGLLSTRQIARDSGKRCGSPRCIYVKPIALYRISTRHYCRPCAARLVLSTSASITSVITVKSI